MNQTWGDTQFRIW